MKKFLSNSLIVSLLLFLSKILGFIRDMLLASAFGSGVAIQAFLLAFKLPEVMRKITSSGAITQVLSPYIKDNVSNHQRNFIASILFVVSCLLLGITIVAIIFGYQWIEFYAYGMNGDSHLLDLAYGLFVIMIPYVLFIFVVALISACLNSHQKYVVAASIPLVLNIVMIMAVLTTKLYGFSIYAVAYGVLVAGIIQLGIAIYSLYRIYGSINITKAIISFKDVRAVAFLKKLPTSFLGVSALQLGSLAETFFASFLVSGSLAWLYYADRVNQFIYAIFGTAISTVMIPYLLKYKNNNDKFNICFSKVFNFSIFITVPAICALTTLAKPIMFTLFCYGKFSVNDVNATSLAMSAYVLSLFCFVMIRIIISALYIQQKTKIVFNVGIICLFITIVLDIIVVRYCGMDYYAFIYIAAVTSIVSLINLVIQIMFMCDFKYSNFKVLFLPFSLIIKIVVSSIVLVVVLNLFNLTDQYWLAMGMLERCVHMILMMVAGLSVYLLSMLILRSHKSHH